MFTKALLELKGLQLKWHTKNKSVNFCISTLAYAKTYLRIFKEQEIRYVAKSDTDFMFNTDANRVGRLFKKHKI